jgi:hypothetical protein
VSRARSSEQPLAAILAASGTAAPQLRGNTPVPSDGRFEMVAYFESDALGTDAGRSAPLQSHRQMVTRDDEYGVIEFFEPKARPGRCVMID